MTVALSGWPIYEQVWMLVTAGKNLYKYIIPTSRPENSQLRGCGQNCLWSPQAGPELFLCHPFANRQFKAFVG